MSLNVCSASYRAKLADDVEEEEEDNDLLALKSASLDNEVYYSYGALLTLLFTLFQEISAVEAVIHTSSIHAQAESRDQCQDVMLRCVYSVCFGFGW
jgi:hypothetical protein